MKKVCTKCEEEKDVSEFYYHHSRKHHLGRCKNCIDEDNHLYRKTPEGKAARQREDQKRKGTPGRKASLHKYNTSDKYKAMKKRFNETSKGRACQARAHEARRQRGNDTINDLTASEWNEILIMQKNSCAICSIGFEETQPQRDHIVPVVSGGSLTKENVQALCKSCNSFKGSKLMEELI